MSITLISENGVSYDISRDIAFQSPVIKRGIESTGFAKLAENSFQMDVDAVKLEYIIELLSLPLDKK